MGVGVWRELCVGVGVGVWGVCVCVYTAMRRFMRYGAKTWHGGRGRAHEV